MGKPGKSIEEVMREAGVFDPLAGGSQPDGGATPFDSANFQEAYAKIKEKRAAGFSAEDDHIEPLTDFDDICRPVSEDQPPSPTQEPPKNEIPEKEEAPVIPDEPDPAPSDEIKAIQSGMEQLERDVKTISESSVKTAGEIREMHKLYHNEFASRLKSMQEELDRYHEMDKGRAFDGILGEVAKLYCDNESVIDQITDDKIKKRIRYMFMDIVQILEANAVFRQKSNLGDKRNPRHCQVVERIPTNNPQLHDTVALSRGTGFYIENRSLVKELVDIYLLTEKTADQADEI